MPEVQEGAISNATATNILTHIERRHGSVENGPHCLTAYGDLTEAEREADAKIKLAIVKGTANEEDGFPSGTNAQLGLPIEFKLENKAVRALRRGTTSKQTPILFGPQLEPPNGYEELRLLGVFTSPRNVILKLHPNLYLQIRKFSITLAFDFGEYVLAFLSSDGITQFHWASTFEELPAKQCDLVHNFGAYLPRFVAWLSNHKPSTKKTAQEVIRSVGEIFPGIGMYTVNELFARAGLPIDLPDHLLWSCMCCVGRLLEALWTVHAEAIDRVQYVLKPVPLPTCASSNALRFVQGPSASDAYRWDHPWCHNPATSGLCTIPAGLREEPNEEQLPIQGMLD
ncbi:hypothetical protein FRC00_003669 [Tulasnella sp. 408]|nr:hypothetical protein FRC00_003669 [Tulasnella sp. 408]